MTQQAPKIFCMKCGTQLFVEPVWTGHYSQFKGVKTYKLLLWCPGKKYFWDGHNRYFFSSDWSGTRSFDERQIIEMGLLEIDLSKGDENADMDGTSQTNTA